MVAHLRPSTPVLLVLVLSLLLAACQGEPTPAASPTATDSPTATPVPSRPTPTPFPTLTPTPPVTPTVPQPTPTPRPAGSPTPAMTPLPPANEKLAPYADPELGFAISYPESWDAIPGDFTQGEPLFFAEGPTGLPFFLVDAAYPTEVGTLESHAKEALDGLGPSIKLFGQGSTALGDGTPAQFFNVESSGSGVTLNSRILVAVKGSRVYVMVAQTLASDFQNRLPQFEEVAKSIKLSAPVVFGASRENALTLLMPGPTTLDPAIMSDAGSYNYVVQVFSGLVTLDRDLKVVPDLAEKWEVSADGRAYTFTLRQNAKFHNGRAVTAEDIKYSIDRAANPTTRSRTAALYLDDIVGVTERLAGTSNTVTGVEVVDPQRIRISIKQPVPYFLSKLTYPVAYVVDKDNIASGGDVWFAKPNGTGPFKLRGWSIEVATVLEANKDFYRTPPAVPAVLVWNFGPNPLAMYHAGELDVAPLGLADLEIARKAGSATAPLVKETSELTVNYLGFNTRQAPFNDPRARLAFLLASDMSKVITEDLAGAVTRATGLMPVGLPGHNADLKPYYDAARAKTLWQQLIAEKGAAANTVRILVQGSSLGADLAALADQWEATLGVQLEFSGTRFSDLDRSLESSRAHIFSYGWVADYPDPQNFLDVLFHSQSTNNHGLYKNVEFDKLIEQARIEPDQAKRLKLYQQAEVLLMNDAGLIPLYYGRNYNLVSPDVKSWFLSPQNLPDLVGVSLTRALKPLPPPATQA